MFLDRMKAALTALAAAGLLGGCMADSTNPSTNNGNPSADAGVEDPGRDAGPNPVADGGVQDPGAFAKSERANLRFKRATRLRNDVAQALALDPADVCLELGQYHCTDFVHTISLGGVEPYTLGLNEPFDDTTVTAPIAVERVALYACEARVRADLAGNGVIFRELGVDGDGKLADVDAAGVEQSIDTLYKRALLRPPSGRELSHLKQLYRDIEADGQGQPARDWAILSCFSVLSSMENLFY